jgi:hypothetical protein
MRAWHMDVSIEVDCTSKSSKNATLRSHYSDLRNIETGHLYGREEENATKLPMRRTEVFDRPRNHSRRALKSIM